MAFDKMLLDSHKTGITKKRSKMEGDKMKRSVTTIATFALLVLVFAGCSSSEKLEYNPSLLKMESNSSFPTSDQISDDYTTFIAQLKSNRTRDSLLSSTAETPYLAISITGMAIGVGGAVYGATANSPDNAKKVAAVTSILTAAVSALVTFLDLGSKSTGYQSDYLYWDRSISTFETHWKLTPPTDSGSLTKYQQDEAAIIADKPY